MVNAHSSKQLSGLLVKPTVERFSRFSIITTVVPINISVQHQQCSHLESPIITRQTDMKQSTSTFAASPHNESALSAQCRAQVLSRSVCASNREPVTGTIRTAAYTKCDEASLAHGSQHESRGLLCNLNDLSH